MQNKKSAKDLAFEQERVKFRKQLREKDAVIKEQREEIDKLLSNLYATTSELDRYKDWVERLLQYMDLSEEDLKRALENEKEKEKTTQMVKSFLGLIDRFSGNFGL